MVRWSEMEMAVADARALEKTLKGFGEPPQPRDRFEGCVNGRALRHALVAAAGNRTWEAGYIEALFDVGEQLHRLFTPRFKTLWEAVGTPPGPGAALA
jgi:hypothetical protein